MRVQMIEARWAAYIALPYLARGHLDVDVATTAPSGADRRQELRPPRGRGNTGGGLDYACAG